MIKTAIFVEGQTELIFTRELILKFFEYQNVWVECYTLFNDHDLNPTEYSFENRSANLYFQIINIGNDKKVISSIIKREKYLFSDSQGFDKVVGLRDMYSKEYREAVQNATIDIEISQKFINNHQQTISTLSSNPEKIKFHFAIMELESWLLAISNIFERFDSSLNYEKIRTVVNFDLQNEDPEKCIFHPANTIEKIFEIIGETYDKKKGEVNKFMGRIDKEHFIELLESSKCSSFNDYCESLHIRI
ncbi:DUF4276 family protein [Flavobacterium sp.]|uniref:DUF4276 family protein n=1 Tax=Flavobacterium sp. TaxID=239 RepID=UPI00260B675E|nr:DUF4276 family protein [Flavobacterium sp.]